MIQRIKDWLHEREIARLTEVCREAYAAGDKAKARHFFHAMGRAIAARSPGAIVRMEERKGLRFRRSLKRRAMDSFCSGRVPAWLVAVVFRLFKLRSL